MIVVEPAPTIVTVLPLTVATAVFELTYETPRLEEAVAPRLKVASPYVFPANAPNVIVCAAFATTNVPDAVPW